MTTFSLLIFSREEVNLELANLKRQKEELMLTNVQLEQSLQRQREKMMGTEEQLRNLEQKVSISDINVANQVLLKCMPSWTEFPVLITHVSTSFVFFA